MCILSYKQIQKCFEKTFFMNVTKNNKRFFQTSFSGFKNAKKSTFEHTETFFLQNLLLFFCFCNHFLIFYKTERTCYQLKFL